MEYLAHISSDQSRTQTLLKHSRNVAELCRQADAAEAFPRLTYLIGLLHDMGKATADFQKYLRWAVDHPGEKKDHQNHAATGAIYCWERWRDKDGLTAQILSLCILGHHTGLADCIGPDGTSEFLNSMKQDRGQLNYEEAVRNFEADIASPEELDGLFCQAKEETERWAAQADTAVPNQKTFCKGAMVRMLLGILADADRWDSACFEYDEDPLEPHSTPDWEAALARFDHYRAENFTGTAELDGIRAKISEDCAGCGVREQGIYSLTVPTGGGKTFASLRFALIHAREHRLKRIFYIIPYNTILDQNAADIQDALGDTVSVLVHHSNVVVDEKDADGNRKDRAQIEDEWEEYRRLTERWDSDVILTSMVQFLNALFKGKNSNARRMRQLADSILIFDEIQSIPKKCMGLFERAVRFLHEFCRCTAVLCTATQPQFDPDLLPRAEMIADVDGLYRKLKRVRYLPELRTDQAMTNAEAAARVCGFPEKGRSALFVVNTKKTAWELYRQSRDLLRESGWTIVDPAELSSEEQMREKAAECGPREILCVHLSTLMCPAHRLYYIKAVKIWTKAGKPVLCISTALIEAGINVSFPVVIRSAAGLPSVIQAGGRCNRNCETECGEVYIWRLTEESLTRLPDIEKGKEILSNMLDPKFQYYRNPDALGMPEAIRDYFGQEKDYTENVRLYPYTPKDRGMPSDLVEMLGLNREYRKAANQRADKSPALLTLRQSFRTAELEFQVIDEDTTAVLVPFGEGKKIVEALCGNPDMKELRLLLKCAQSYCVNLYPNMIRRLTGEGALTVHQETGLRILRDGHYDLDGGVTVTPAELEACIY